MTDSGIKKVVIPKASLVDLTSDNKYLIRYRIVSEDKNRVSAWSPVFSLDARDPGTVDADYSINGRVVTLVWDDEESRPQYDIFVKFDSQDYVFHGTSSIHTYNFINYAEDSFRFAIQVSGINKVRSDKLEIYESEEIPLV